MLVRSASLVISAPAVTSMPEPVLPEIALLGRSNVGKSSLINALLGRRSLARTSSQPGKTRLFNFYLINESFFLVDMPGYGYARFAQAERERLRRNIVTYLTERSSLRMVIQLVDFRHEPSRDDVEFNLYLRQYGIPFMVVASKADKIPRSRHIRQRGIVGAALGVNPADIVLTSSVEKRGIEELWQRLPLDDITPGEI